MPGPGKSVPKTVEMSAPHAVANHFAETAAHRIFRIDMRGIDVARHNREELDVLLGKRTLKQGGVADIDFVESAVFDELHLNTRNRLLRVTTNSPRAFQDLIARDSTKNRLSQNKSYCSARGRALQTKVSRAQLIAHDQLWQASMPHPANL